MQNMPAQDCHLPPNAGVKKDWSCTCPLLCMFMAYTGTTLTSPLCRHYPFRNCSLYKYSV